jgi:hypothetical protein
MIVYNNSIPETITMEDIPKKTYNETSEKGRFQEKKED